MKQDVVDQMMITTSSYAVKGGGATAVGGGIYSNISDHADKAINSGLTLADYGVIVGISGVILGLVIQAVATWRRDARESERHNLLIKSRYQNNHCELDADER